MNNAKNSKAAFTCQRSAVQPSVSQSYIVIIAFQYGCAGAQLRVVGADLIISSTNNHQDGTGINENRVLLSLHDGLQRDCVIRVDSVFLQIMFLRLLSIS